MEMKLKYLLFCLFGIILVIGIISINFDDKQIDNKDLKNLSKVNISNDSVSYSNNTSYNNNGSLTYQQKDTMLKKGWY